MLRDYCEWYDKKIQDLTEHEEEQCEENGQDCADCPDRVFKDTTED